MPNFSDLPPKGVFPPVFRVFEHELLRIGDLVEGQVFSERHLESLAGLSEQTGNRYFTLGHRSVRFRHFVGILATPHLRVEILPKTDRHQVRAAAKWQDVLIDMLQSCRFVRTESTGKSYLGSRSGRLLEWYVRFFVAELQALLRYGLVQAYRPQQENLSVWKGRLRFAEQLKYNSIRKERFFVEYDQYNLHHPANVLIGSALLRLQPFPMAPDLKMQLNYLARFFPPPPQGTVLSGSLSEQFRQDRRLDRYAQALTITQHILQQELPDIRSGENPGLVLLFDMNLLFEEYLYRQLLFWKPAGIQIERQQSRVFWGQNRLRPDLVLAGPQGRWVLDAKWRILHTQQPAADELRQIYLYSDYFHANHGVLVFPETDTGRGTQTQDFAPLPDSRDQNRTCRIYFARVLQEQGGLNRELGKELYATLM